MKPLKSEPHFLHGFNVNFNVSQDQKLHNFQHPVQDQLLHQRFHWHTSQIHLHLSIQEKNKILLISWPFSQYNWNDILEITVNNSMFYPKKNLLLHSSLFSPIFYKVKRMLLSKILRFLCRQYVMACYPSTCCLRVFNPQEDSARSFKKPLSQLRWWQSGIHLSSVPGTLETTTHTDTVILFHSYTQQSDVVTAPEHNKNINPNTRHRELFVAKHKN